MNGANAKLLGEAMKIDRFRLGAGASAFALGPLLVAMFVHLHGGKIEDHWAWTILPGIASTIMAILATAVTAGAGLSMPMLWWQRAVAVGSAFLSWVSMLFVLGTYLWAHYLKVGLNDVLWAEAFPAYFFCAIIFVDGCVPALMMLSGIEQARLEAEELQREEAQKRRADHQREAGLAAAAQAREEEAQGESAKKAALLAKGSGRKETDIDILKALFKHGDMTVSALVDAARKTRVTVITALNALADEGFVTKDVGVYPCVYRLKIDTDAAGDE